MKMVHICHVSLVNRGVTKKGLVRTRTLQASHLQKGRRSRPRENLTLPKAQEMPVASNATSRRRGRNTDRAKGYGGQQLM